MDLDFDAVLRFAKTLDGRDLHTQAQKKAFRVQVAGDILVYTPASTRASRTDGRKVVQQVLDRYNLTQSLRPGNYQDITYNSSYLLTLVAMLVGSEERSA